MKLLCQNAKCIDKSNLLVKGTAMPFFCNFVLHFAISQVVLRTPPIC